MSKSKGVVATLKDEIRRINEEAQGLEVGSEEYLNSSKAVAQLADSVNKLDKVDVMQLCKDGTMIILLIRRSLMSFGTFLGWSEFRSNGGCV